MLGKVKKNLMQQKMDELERIKKLAGVNEFKGYAEYKIDENPSN